MKKSDIEIGEHYTAKVSGKVVIVRIKWEHAVKGWMGYNLRTGNEVRIKTAARLRKHVPRNIADDFATLHGSSL